MKKIKTYYSGAIVFTLLLYSFSLSSQNNFIANNTQQSLRDISVLINSNNIYKTVEGSPHINEIFFPATIKGYANNFFFARYNAYNGEMEVKIDDDILVLNKSTKDLEIKFQQSNKVYKVFYYVDADGNSKRGFLVILKKSEEYDLLKQESIKFVKGKEAISGYEFSIPNRFERLKDKYFLKLHDKILHIPQKKRKLYKLFPNDIKKIKSFLKKKKISLKEETDLIKLASFLADL